MRYFVDHFFRVLAATEGHWPHALECAGEIDKETFTYLHDEQGYYINESSDAA